jgi:hypothetical protein
VVAKEDPATFKRVMQQGQQILLEDFNIDPQALRPLAEKNTALAVC